MIVSNDDCMRVGDQRGLERFTRVHKTGSYAELGITAIIPS